MRSLRTRLLIRSTIALALVFAIAAGAVYWLMRRSLISEFDGALTSRARAIAALAEQDGLKVKIEIEPGQMPEFSNGSDHYFQLWRHNGNVIARSASLGAADLRKNATIASGPQFEFVTLPNGVAGRQILMEFQPHREDKKDSRPPLSAQLAMARPTHDLNHTLASLRWLLLTVFAAAVIASVAVMGLAIRQGLLPLKGLASSIEKVGMADLSERIAANGTPRELLPVVDRLNDLLARLDLAVKREKSFSADVAHELRTPLAGLETTLEVCASRDRDSEAYQQVVQKCLTMTRGMKGMVNNLLLLARAESRQLTPASEPVDLEKLIRESWSQFAQQAEQRGLRVQWELTRSSPQRADPNLLRIIFNNLFDNAVTYADQAGSIKVRAASRDGQLEFELSNSASQLPRENLEQVFDRFWRGDVARSSAGLHCGLGLTLCRRITTILGGTIVAASENGTFIIKIAIPTPAALPI
jgi:heavy metal sensor kinase